jgi:hypothetical protein
MVYFHSWAGPLIPFTDRFSRETGFYSIILIHGFLYAVNHPGLYCISRPGYSIIDEGPFLGRKTT